MTTSISGKFKAISQLSNITAFNTDPFNTWKGAFRECVKLSSLVIDRQKDEETFKRLNTWCTRGKTKPFGKYAIQVCEAYAAEGIHIAHYDMRYAKPLDIQLLNEIAMKFDHVITLEDAAVVGGFGSAVAEYYATLDMDSMCSIKLSEES